MQKLRSFGFILVGAVAGVLISLNFQAIADRAGIPPDRRQVFFRLVDPEPLVFGDESILIDGVPVGRITSAAYGHTLAAACGVGYLQGDVPAGAGFEIACLRGRVGAVVSEKPFYDPAGQRLRS